MDATDKKILDILQSSGRITNLQLAEAVNLSPTPCLRRVARLESSGIIKLYRAEVDAHMAGYPIHALVLIKLGNNTRTAANEFAEAMQAVSAVTECYMTAGKLDYIANVYARSLSDYESVVKDQLGSLPHIASMETMFILNEIVERRGIAF